MLTKYVPFQVHIDPALIDFAEKQLVRDYSFFSLEDCLSTFLSDRLQQELWDHEERRARAEGVIPPPSIPEAEIPF